MFTKMLCVIIVEFWLLMTALFIEKKIIPVLRLASPVSFEEVVEVALIEGDVSYTIHWGGEKIGTSLYSVEKDEIVSLMNKTYLNCKMRGLADFSIETNTTINANKDFKLIDLTMTSKISGISLLQNEQSIFVYGSVVDNFIDMEIHTPSEVIRKKIPYDGKSTLTAGLSPVSSIKNLSVGKKWNVQWIDAFSSSISSMTAQVVSIENIDWKDKSIKAFRVEIIDENLPKSEQKQKYIAWIDFEGRLIRQDIMLPLLKQEYHIRFIRE